MAAPLLALSRWRRPHRWWPTSPSRRCSSTRDCPRKSRTPQRSSSARSRITSLSEHLVFSAQLTLFVLWTLDFGFVTFYTPPMLTRRDVLKSGYGRRCRRIVRIPRMASAAAPQPLTKVSFDVPPGACDCHVHVFGDPKKYPFFEGRSYTPEMASADELGSCCRRFVSSASSSCSRACTAPTTRARSTACARSEPRARRGGD